MATWNKINRPTDDGTIVPMQAPFIISASRSTDIPAFYADWFFHRLQKGYSAWINPFNGIKSYVSYENTRFIVFWSKNPRPLLKFLHILKDLNIGCYVQYTLNDYENEGFEKIPSIDYRIETFRLLVDKLGFGSVIWRFDPMILTDSITISDLLDKIQYIGDKLKGYTEKLVFSYADISLYKKVKSNLDKSGIHYNEWSTEQMDEFAKKLSELNSKRRWNYDIATCGEKIDVSKYNISHNRCIDGDLIVRLAWKDKVLMDFMKVKVCEVPTPSLFGEIELPLNAVRLPDNHFFISKHKKDPGQRLFCECMESKDIGEYNTCPHLCEYCYANASKDIAILNWNRHKTNTFSDTITGL